MPLREMGENSQHMFASTIISQTFFNYFKWDPPIHDAEAQVALFSLLERNKMHMAMVGNFPHSQKMEKQGNGVKEWISFGKSC